MILKKDMKFLKKIINFYNNIIFLRIIGALSLLLFIWMRFIRERVPRNIPFSLSTWSFTILLIICIGYIYIIYRIFIPSSETKVINILKPFTILLLRPFLVLHDFLVTNIYTKKILLFLVKLLLQLLHLRKRFHDRLLVYSFIFIFPKCLLALCLAVDCFYKGQLYFTYWCIIVISLPLLVKYLCYCGKTLIDLMILEKYFLIEITSKDLIYEETDYDTQGFLKDHLPVRFWKLHHMEFDLAPSGAHYNYVRLTKFIEYQSTEIGNFDLPHEYKILFQDEREDILFLSDKPSRHPSLSKKACEDIVSFCINFTVLKEEFETVRRYYFQEKYNFNLLTIITNSCNIILLFCWIYILMKSFHTLPKNAFDWLIFLIPKYENPFI